MKYLKLIIFFLSIVGYSQSGKVIKIKDGDTVVVLDDQNNQTTLRLAEVDCPESSQAFGKKAKEFTINQVALKTITYKVTAIDRYGRSIAKVYYDGKYLSEEIIKNGFGWHYKKYSDSKKLATLEQFAQDNKKGLWVDSKVIAPWDFRKMAKKQSYGNF